jgi:hypothetical protein
MYRVAMVCEGPADREIVQSVLDHYLDDYDVHPIQPPTGVIGGDAGPFGGGWKGVRTWCTQEASNGGLDHAMRNADLLIVQVDTDVAGDPDIARLKPCPPARDSSNEIHSLILKWLKLRKLPKRIVTCVPAMASETWALVALFPNAPELNPCDDSDSNECIECRTDIKSILRKHGKHLRPKLVVSQDGELKNQSSGYKKQSHRICRAWPEVVELCHEARRFHDDLTSVIDGSRR